MATDLVRGMRNIKFSKRFSEVHFANGFLRVFTQILALELQKNGLNTADYKTIRKKSFRISAKNGLLAIVKNYY
jgi:hypothetical protein